MYVLFVYRSYVKAVTTYLIKKILQLRTENENLNSQIEVLESNIKALKKEKDQIIAVHRKYSSRSIFESDIDDQVHINDTVCSYV